MASDPKIKYQVFLCIFQTNFVMATLGLKERKGREKVLPYWLSQFSFKFWYYERWVGHHASFPPRRSVKTVDILLFDALIALIVEPVHAIYQGLPLSIRQLNVQAHVMSDFISMLIFSLTFSL